MIARLTTALAAAILLPLPAVAEVEIQEITTPGGITAWLVEEHSIPFTSIEVQFEGGANEEPLEARGATYLMMGLLEEGAGDMDARAFSERREALAARTDFDANNDSVTIGLSFLTENREESVDLMRAALVDPSFDPEAVERVREQVLAGLAADARDPQEIAGETFAALSFPEHPYGSRIEGTPETVAALNIDDLRTAHTRALTRDRARVGVTGDITAEELAPLLDRLLGDLPESDPVDIPEVETALDGGITVVDFPSPQSVVLFGHSGIAFDDPDYFAAFILNHIIGGRGFDSRLMTEVREKRGLTYGIGTFLSPRDKSEEMLGQFSSSNDKAAEAIEIVRAEWAHIAEEGVTPEELDAAKTYLTGAYPLRFDGNSRIAGILTGMQSLDLPIDYIPNRNDRIEAVTLDDVKRVAAELLRPEDLHFVVVGQPDGLRSGSF
ncbi:M16 family metallopeptidase [Jannaschia marina]|uniref:M16 family metallopeptidase n=1 Tax=Jannaschia marina TaxID=2741674 RepID=UPI0015C7B454|nr:pitrilysin family protein [Jannaschia marina]